MADANRSRHKGMTTDNKKSKRTTEIFYDLRWGPYAQIVLLFIDDWLIIQDIEKDERKAQQEAIIFSHVVSCCVRAGL